jgi:hypothetical protein
MGKPLHELIHDLAQKIIRDTTIDRDNRAFLPALTHDEYMTMLLALGGAKGVFYEQERRSPPLRDES